MTQNTIRFLAIHMFAQKAIPPEKVIKWNFWTVDDVNRWQHPNSFAARMNSRWSGNSHSNVSFAIHKSTLACVILNRWRSVLTSNSSAAINCTPQTHINRCAYNETGFESVKSLQTRVDSNSSIHFKLFANTYQLVVDKQWACVYVFCRQQNCIHCASKCVFDDGMSVGFRWICDWICVLSTRPPNKRHNVSSDLLVRSYNRMVWFDHVPSKPHYKSSKIVIRWVFVIASESIDFKRSCWH